MDSKEVPGEPPADFEEDDEEKDEQEPETTVEQFEGEPPDSVKQWMAEATANNIKLVKKLPEEKSRNTTKADRKCFWDLHYVLGWSNDKIAVVTGFTPETVGRHLSRMKDAEEAREEERRTSQPPGQTQQQQLSTPLAQPTFQPEPPQQPRAPPQPEPEEDEEEEVEIPEPKYMRPEVSEPFKDRLKELKRIMKSQNVDKAKMKDIMETVSDVDSIMETPRELKDYLWRVQKIDPAVADIITKRLFRVESRHRHYDEYMSHQYGDHYGYGGHDEYGYPIRDDYRDGYGRGPPPRQYRGYGPPPDRYGRGGSGGGITEEEAKHREQEAAARAKETAEKDKQIEQLAAQVQNLQQQIQGLQENPPSQFDGPVEVVDVQEEGPDGKPVWKRITRPYEDPDKKIIRDLVRESTKKDNSSSKNDEDAKEMIKLILANAEQKAKMEMEQQKHMQEKEFMILQNDSKRTQESLQKFIDGGRGDASDNEELTLILHEMRNANGVQLKFMENVSNRMDKGMELVQFAMAPQEFAAAQMGKAAAASQELQFREGEAGQVEGWIGGDGSAGQQG